MGATATATAAATKKHRKQKLQLRPKKNSVSKTKTKIKTEAKKKNSSNNNSIKSSNEKKNQNETAIGVGESENSVVIGSQQLSFFINQYQSANGVERSSLELDSLEEKCSVELCQGPAENFTGQLDEHVKDVIGSAWKQILCGKDLQEGQVDPGSPAIIVISSSALRSLELLREMRSLTKECHAAKLFSKHMKIEEQVSILKNRVNIASGTPSRMKKLIDMEALGLSRLAVVVLDMHTDVKGYSLFTLRQVRDEFWGLYRSYFHQRLLGGYLRLCLYGPLPTNSGAKKRKPNDN